MADATDLDPGLAVMAHGLLNSMAVVAGTLSTVEEHPEIDLEALRFMVDRALAHAGLVAAMLKDLAQGLPLGANAMLEEIDLRSVRRRRISIDGH